MAEYLRAQVIATSTRVLKTDDKTGEAGELFPRLSFSKSLSIEK